MTEKYNDILEYCKNTLFLEDTIINKLKTEKTSPLNFIENADLPQNNNLSHSLRVLKNLYNLTTANGKTKFTFNNYDWTLLLYSSLLHDISKTKDDGIKDDLDNLGIKCYGLETDHGILSAHYIKQCYQKRKINFIHLNKNKIIWLLNIIAFHNTGLIHSCFMKNRSISRKELYMYLLFWLADIADGSNERAKTSKIIDCPNREPKNRARLKIFDISIKRNNVLWHISRNTQDIEKSIMITNKILEKNRILLLAFGLPIAFGYKTKNRIYSDNKIDRKVLSDNDLCLDVTERLKPLILSEDKVSDLYEMIAESFSCLRVSKTKIQSNYFTPIILEIKDVKNDKFNKTKPRNDRNITIDIIKKYTLKWSNKDDDAAKDFYFGYTHGQRIYQYLYPYTEDDLNLLQKTKKEIEEEKKKESPRLYSIKLDINQWSREGRINQFNSIAEIIKEEGHLCRTAYVVIPNPIIDRKGSAFQIPTIASPALLVIHFIIEKNKKLTAIALFRALELSTFFLVNYLEVKDILIKLKNLLHKDKKYANLELGRIIMLSSLAYFDPQSVLLDKPKLCTKSDTEIINFAKKIRSSKVKEDFVDLLNDFSKDYKIIETDWCDIFNKHTENQRLKNAIDQLAKSLNKIETNRSEYSMSITDVVRKKKTNAIKRFIRILSSI